MTFRERLVEMVVAHGVPRNEAEKVIEKASSKINKGINDHRVTWDSPESDVPFVAYNNIWEFFLRKETEKWIDENNSN